MARELDPGTISGSCDKPCQRLHSCRVVENQLLALGLDLDAKAAMGAAWSHLFEFRLVTQRNPSTLGRPQRGTLAVLLV